MAGLNSTPDSPLSWILNPWYASSLIAMFVQAIFWVQALKTCDLAMAYPMTALVFGGNLACAACFFSEEVTLTHLFGITLIIAGGALSARQPA